MLLDIFTILFESDAKKLDAGLKKSDKAADDLVDSLKKVDKQADGAGSSFAGMASKALGALAAVASVGSVISGTISKAADVAAIGQTADALGVAVEELDAFGRAAQAMGGDAQGARDSVTDMAESIGEALQDVESGRAKTFDALGVSLRGVDGQAVDAVEGILRLSDAVQGMIKEEAVFRIKELGITDNRTVEMVLKGRKELEKMLQVQKDSGVITKEQAKQAQEFTLSMNRLRGSLDTAGTGFMTLLIPALEKGVEWLTKIVDWANENKTVITGFFIAIAGIVAAVYLPAMISAGIATLAATWPILAIGAAIAVAAAAFALIYDDIMNFIEGNDSMIGQLVSQYPIIGDVIDTVVAAFKQLMEWGGIAFDFLKSGASSLLDVYKSFGKGIVAVFEFIGAMWKAQFDFIMAGIDAVVSGLASAASFFGFGGDEDEAAVDIGNGGNPGAGAGVGTERADATPKDGISVNANKVNEAVAAGKQQVAVASASPLNSTTSSSISNSVASTNKETNVQVGELIVQTPATDTDGIMAAGKGSLENQLAQLDSEYSSGVAR